MKLLNFDIKADGCTVKFNAVDSDTGVVEIDATGEFHAGIIFEHAAPLNMSCPDGITADLQLRNDRYGYSAWELNMNGKSAGYFQIKLESVPAPKSALRYTPEDYALFCKEFNSRPSKFPDDKESFAAWQFEYRKKLWIWITGDGEPERIVPDVSYRLLADRENYTIEEVTYRSRPDRKPSALLALPKNGNKPVPLILAIHGHEAEWGKADIGAFSPGHNDDFCHYFASNGFAVFQPPTMDHLLQNENWTLHGEWAWDAIAGLHAVLPRDIIDPNSVAVVGLSTGAFIAEIVTALDDTPKAVIVGGIFTSRNHIRLHCRIPPSCDCGSTRALDKNMEQCDIMAVAAPKFMQVQLGRDDVCFFPGADPGKLNLDWYTGVMPEEEFGTISSELRRAYALSGKPERLSIHFHKAGHAVAAPAALEWIKAAFRHKS